MSIVHSYRGKDSKYPKVKTIKSFGYLDDLEKKYNNPIAFFEEEIQQMNEKKSSGQSHITFSISKEECIPADSTNRKNFGYAALSKIYHELGIHTFFIHRQRHTKEDYNANSIMKLLVFSRP